MKTRALVLCGDQWHPAETVRRGLAAFGGFQLEFLADGAECPARHLDDFSLVILAKANMVCAQNSRPWLTMDMQAGFVDFVRGGGGLLAVHAGTARYEKLPRINRLLGGAFMRHPEPCLVAIEPKNHPLTKNVASFIVKDEHYFVDTNPDIEIFLQSHSAHGVQPAGWARTEGRGRVSVLTPGHDPKVWLNVEFQKLLANSLRWAAGLN